VNTARKPLFESAEWSEEIIQNVFNAASELAEEERIPDGYPVQIEIISAEQMCDALSTIGMPVGYKHWSFGKQYMRAYEDYLKGRRGLAYEIVINSDPCIVYLMQDNPMAMQTLTIAHAAFGHNSFFRNNYLFKELTDASAIIDYLVFARNFVKQCEDKYGEEEVERLLDAAHALSPSGVFRRGYKERLKIETPEERAARLKEDRERNMDLLMEKTLPFSGDKAEYPEDGMLEKRQRELGLPEENILYFLEKHSPILEPWQKEIVRIVRKISQYFYPQRQTKVMNEGFASFVHYHLTQKMYDRGLITGGARIEILHSHTNVLLQREFNDPYFSGLNPYALGFAIFNDIKRICKDPTEEDRRWFPDFAGDPDWRSVIFGYAMQEFRDESFFLQFLSPHLIRKLRLFVLKDDSGDKKYMEVLHIHDDAGYKDVRKELARQHDVGVLDPDIQVFDADLRGDRVLKLRHDVRNGRLLEKTDRGATLRLVSDTLWGYKVEIEGIDEDGNRRYHVYREPDNDENDDEKDVES
jgi:stage V sporulation protein R